MQLEISYFKGIASSMLRKVAAEVGHRIDELVRDIQQELSGIGVRALHHERREQDREAHIFNFGLYFYVRVDACNEVLNRPAHTLVPRRVLPPRTHIFERVRCRVVCTSRDLGRGSYEYHCPSTRCSPTMDGVKSIPAMRPAGIPAVSVGLPCCAVCHC